MHFLLLATVGVIAACPLLMVALMRARRVAGTSPMELGTVFSVIVAAYGLMPLAGFILSGYSFDLNRDARLAEVSASVEDVTAVAILYAAFLFGFCWLYGMLRPRRRGFLPGDVVVSDWRLPFTLVVVAAFVAVLPIVMKWTLGVETAQDYLGTYLELEGQPLWVRQLFGIVLASGTALITAAVTSVFAYSRRLIPLAVVTVAIGAALTIAGGGSRMPAMAALLSMIVAYSLVVRSVPMGEAALYGLMLLGVFAAGQYLRDFLTDDSIDSFAGALVNGEFASVFINALDMLQQRDWLAANGMLPNLYTVDLGRLIPQQLLPFEKLDSSQWYVTTLYPEFAQAGGGLAFGAVAESAAGLGALEALVRGGLLGSLFALGHALLTAPARRSLLSLSAYVWLVVFSYHSFRDTTFSLVARFAFNAVPALALVAIVERVSRHGDHLRALAHRRR
jgi:hypothetical protein